MLNQLIITISLKYQHQLEMKHLACLMDLIVFKIKTGYKLELLSKETMKLLGNTKDIIDSDKNSDNVPRLENV